MAVRRNKGRMRSGNKDRTELTTLQESLLQEAAREVTVAIDGRSQAINLSQVLSRKLLQMAANGSVHAMSNAINELNVAQQLHQRKVEEDVDLGRRLKEHQHHLLATARATGADLDAVLPHPDDIIIEEGVGFEIVGPFDASELEAVKRDCGKRDAAILQAALESRLGPTGRTFEGDQANESPDAGALLMVHILNDALPKRFQKSDVQIALELMRHQGTPKLELLKLAYRKWASVGRPKPRGWRLPPLQNVLRQLDRGLPILMAICQEIKSGKLPSERAIIMRLQQAFP